MFDPLSTAVVVALVRIVAFAISGLLAYFGYCLFSTVPQLNESGGKIEAPGLNITLSRIAPGTFFAICAAGIVIAGFMYPIEISGKHVRGSIASDPPMSNSKIELGVLPSTTTSEFSSKMAADAHITQVLRHIACIRVTYPLKEDELSAIDHARVALMSRIWNPKWGGFEDFETWALEHRGASPPTAAEHIFNQRDPRCLK